MLIHRTILENKHCHFKELSGQLMQGADSLEKTLMLERLRAGGEGDNRG